MTKRAIILLAVALTIAAGCKNRTSNQEFNPTFEKDTTENTRKGKIMREIEEPAINQEAAADSANKEEKEYYYRIVTSEGSITVKLYDETPLHKANFQKLVNENFYNDLRFHRVINGFMIQTGDPFSADTSRVNEWGTGGPGYTIPAEIIPGLTHKKGALAAARLSDAVNPAKASSGSQFYIVQNADNCKHLDGQYTVFGETVDGMDVIDKIASARTDAYDRPKKDIVIDRIYRTRRAKAE